VKRNLSESNRASWTGTLKISIANFGLGAVQYNLRAGKAHGDLKPIKVVKVDSETGRKVVSKRYAAIPAPTTVLPQSQAQAPSINPSSIPAQQVTYLAPQDHFFFEDEFLAGNLSNEISSARIQERQETENGELIEAFDRTKSIEVEPDGFVDLARIPEYKFKEIYMLGANEDKKVREDNSRVIQLARFLLDKNTALVAFFSWGRGYQYYTAVIHPYERKDGKLWLLMGLSEGKLELSDTWALKQKESLLVTVDEVPVVKPKASKPKVSISK